MRVDPLERGVPAPRDRRVRTSGHGRRRRAGSRVTRKPRRSITVARHVGAARVLPLADRAREGCPRRRSAAPPRSRSPRRAARVSDGCRPAVVHLVVGVEGRDVPRNVARDRRDETRRRACSSSSESLNPGMTQGQDLEPDAPLVDPRGSCRGRSAARRRAAGSAGRPSTSGRPCRSRPTGGCSRAPRGVPLPLETYAVRRPVAFAARKTSTAHSEVMSGSL